MQLLHRARKSEAFTHDNVRLGSWAGGLLDDDHGVPGDRDSRGEACRH